ncbi:MAG: YqhA family protein [Deltaproteobacteria bacterium]|nr:YqhA family protein [Deltaproteobacteria bacterium]
MKRIQDLSEHVFETFLFNSRIIVIIAVVGSLVSSVLMFLRGGLQIYQAAVIFVHHPMPQHDVPPHEDLSVILISSVDTFLFATVLLIFAMGSYELFISKIDPASRTPESRPNWLAIHSLDDLKGAVGKVILMILIVRLFEAAVAMKYERPLDLVYIGIAVVFVSLALFLVHLGHKKEPHGPVEWQPGSSMRPPPMPSQHP